jgi:hypothetical protein
MHASFGMPLISTPHDPHFPAATISQHHLPVQLGAMDNIKNYHSDIRFYL